MSRLVAADGLSSCFSMEAKRLVMGEEWIDERETVTSCPAASQTSITQSGTRQKNIMKVNSSMCEKSGTDSGENDGE